MLPLSICHTNDTKNNIQIYFAHVTYLSICHTNDT